MDNIYAIPGARKRGRPGRGDHSGKKHSLPNKGFLSHGKHSPAGFEGPTKWAPFHLRNPTQKWCKERFEASYIPLSLKTLQITIDLGNLDPSQPIDITQLSLTGQFSIDARQEHAGFMLEEEGMDSFVTPINLEVQHASEAAIAAIERAGGTVTTAYYDPYSLSAATNPLKFFKRGAFIPRRMLPHQKHIEYYSDYRSRGYLADPDRIAEDRFVLSQKYGYPLFDLTQSPLKDMLLQRKDPRQIFHGLQPGWVVDVKGKAVVKPKQEQLVEYFAS